MLNIFIALTVLGALPLILFHPFVGVLAWHWIAFMNPHRLGWADVQSLPVSMAVGGATLAMWLLSKERKLPPRDSIIVMLGMLAVWISVTTVFAVAPDGALKIWDRAIKILIFTFVTAATVTNVHRLNAFIWVIVLSIGFYSMKGGLFTVMTGGQYRVWGPPGSFITDNNQLAMAILMTLPLFFYLAQNAALPWVRKAVLAGLVLSVFSVVGSFSRGAFVSLLAVGVFIALKSRKKLLIFSGGGALAAVLAMFVPQDWVERMQSIDDFAQDSSVQGRFDAWLFAWRVAQDRPVTGGGFRAYYDQDYFMSLVPDAVKSRSWHSNYFQILGEHGYIGLVIFATIFLLTWRRSTQLERLGQNLGQSWAEDLGRMCKVSLVAYATAGLFLNMAFFDLYYAIVVIVVCAYVIAAREVRGPEPASGRRPRFAGAGNVARPQGAGFNRR